MPDTRYLMLDSRILVSGIQHQVSSIKRFVMFIRIGMYSNGLLLESTHYLPEIR